MPALAILRDSNKFIVAWSETYESARAAFQFSSGMSFTCILKEGWVLSGLAQPKHVLPRHASTEARH